MVRQYSKTLSLILVASVLFLGDFAIELLVPDVGNFTQQNPQLKRLLWLLLFFALATSVFLFVREHNAPASPSKEGVDGVFGTEVEQANRRAMLGLVRRYWVEGVLHRSLWNNARLILNLEGRPDAVVHPCDLAVRRAGQPDTYIPPGTSILDVYQQEQEELLLLGDPGSGKTTLLLEIAEALLQQAANEPTLPIPVVFNLSPWRKDHARLDEWLVEQLNRDYGIPEKIGRRWVGSGELLLLLDGLDEVAEAHRADCVRAINDYRRKHREVLRPMVVCCRTYEYEELTGLRLGGAVVIEPLTREQVDVYLKDGGKTLAGLRAVLKDEPRLYQELFATPLMLNVAVITYESQSAAELRRTVEPEDRRRRLWDGYIARMFERKQEEVPQYEKQQALNWLAWLGNYLTRKDLQKYLIETMQPDDLPRPWQSFAVRWLPPILVGTYCSLAFFPGNYVGKLVAMLLGAAAIYSRKIELQPLRRFTIRNIFRKWKSIVVETIGAAAFGLAIGAVFAVIFSATRRWSGAVAVRGMLLGAVGAATVGAVVAVAESMFEEKVLDDTIRPNEGIHHSLRAGALAAVFAGSLSAALAVALREAGAPAPLSPVSAGVFGMAYFGLLFGLRASIQHHMLRFLLWRSERFPRNITVFLDWAGQRVLVQRVGGGWRFVHRTLQERLAELDEEKISLICAKIQAE